jgi:hypothetical protein
MRLLLNPNQNNINLELIFIHHPNLKFGKETITIFSESYTIFPQIINKSVTIQKSMFVIPTKVGAHSHAER